MNAIAHQLRSLGNHSIIRSTRTCLATFLFGIRGIPLLIALLTSVAFLPALWNGFVEWDDNVNLLNNPSYRGLGWTQLRWMFTTVLAGHWIPLTWVTFGLDYLVWGMNPFGYHLTSVLLHAANAGVFYLLALRLLRRATTGLGETTLRLGAGAAALFFAIHPLRAESVAWATERRDILSGLFFLLTILTYLKASEMEEARRWRWLAGSVGLFALALLSKSIVMTLPVVLILLDLYPLGRLGGGWREWTAPEARRAWAEKLPYLLLALAGAGMALYAQYRSLSSLEKFPLPARAAVALYGLWFYAWKTVFPLGLVVMYELPAQVSLLDPPLLLSAIAVGAITVGLFLARRSWPAGLAVWVYYGVLLAPAIGIVHSGYQITDDRYSYLSCLGWALLVGAGVCAVVQATASGTLRRWWARVAAGAAAAWFLGLAALTWQQVEVWRDTDTLWRHALEFDPDCSLCHFNLGVTLYNQGHAELAIEHLQRTLALRPDRVTAHHSLGVASARLGRVSEAIWHFQRVLEKYPDRADTRNNLAVMLSAQGKLEEAIKQLRQSIQVDPTHFETYSNLATALADQGKPAEAIKHYRRAIELKPDSPLPRIGLARAYLALGKTSAAQEEDEIVKRLDDQPTSQRYLLVKHPPLDSSQR